MTDPVVDIDFLWIALRETNIDVENPPFQWLELPESSAPAVDVPRDVHR